MMHTGQLGTVRYCIDTGSQSSSSADQRVATTGDTSPVAQSGAALALPGGAAASGNATLATPGSVVQQGGGGVVGLRIDNDTGQVTVGVPPDQVGKLIEDLVSRQSDASADALSTVSRLAASTSSAGDVDRNKILLYVSLGALAIVGLIVYSKK